MRNLGQILRQHRRVVTLFVLMVLLPAAVFATLIARAVRSERLRLEYEKTQRQRQIVRLIEADLTNWLFSAAAGSARGSALLRFDVRGDRIVFPAFALSLSARESPQQRPFDAGPPDRKQVYSLERVDLVEAAREAIESCQHVARAGRIRLVGADAAPLWVCGDRMALRHAIQNLVENAAKYSPPESPIVVECAPVNGAILVEVRDRGIGIPAEEQGKIFEKFYRGRHVSGLNVQGVGIGLALVRHVVESHGGSIAVDSHPGAGSRFSLRLPRVEA